MTLKEFDKKFKTEINKISLFVAKNVKHHFQGSNNYYEELIEESVQEWYSKGYYLKIQTSYSDKQIYNYIVTKIRWIMWDLLVKRSKTIQQLRNPEDLNKAYEQKEHHEDMPEPESEFNKKEKIYILEKAISQLSEIDQSYIVDHYFRGRTKREIANKFGVSSPAVTKRMQRILKDLAQNPNIKGLR